MLRLRSAQVRESRSEQRGIPAFRFAPAGMTVLQEKKQNKLQGDLIQ
jgi:hypothetical protein